MRAWIAALLLTVPLDSLATEETSNLMSTASITCPQYLALDAVSPEKAALESWVAGRVVAIVPATFQTELRKIPVSKFRKDLQDLCAGSIPETTLFEASALLAYGYQQEPRH